ncbi:CLOCK-interacting pacemaker-like [Dunckerocampus dactyliophorus]|uniref:CLOCK-interacting pacemaker-like n=1 Tax=Dunckerocampus dactyliophorus TaxID=161453 RepID=UPI002404996B|nr:CLOCK-interacting pacemaker-like [Dunckerocampus dactyliophorus]
MNRALCDVKPASGRKQEEAGQQFFNIRSGKKHSVCSQETNMSSFSQSVHHRTPSFTRGTHHGASKQDLERDSGFSDASSEYLSAVDGTDCEDAGRKRSAVSRDMAGVQLAVMGGSYAGLSPMLIMNNLVLNQPSQVTPAEKQWGFPSSLSVMSPSQMVLLHPMMSNSSSSPKTASDNGKQSKSYTSALKSYPRIAPNPVDAPSKRSSRMRSSFSAHRRHQQGNRLYGAPTTQRPLQAPSKASLAKFEAANNRSALSAESSDQLSEKSLSFMTGITSVAPHANQCRTEVDPDLSCPDNYQDSLLAESNKLTRFSNTYNILSNCGLLGITMRTKQLIKENKRTQGQLQLLQEQTALLLEALGSGDPHLWTKLQLSLQDYDK